MANSTQRGDVWLSLDPEAPGAWRTLNDSRGQRFAFVENRHRVVTRILKDTLAREFVRFLP